MNNFVFYTIDEAYYYRCFSLKYNYNISNFSLTVIKN